MFRYAAEAKQKPHALIQRFFSHEIVLLNQNIQSNIKYLSFAPYNVQGLSEVSPQIGENFSYESQYGF